MKYQNKKLYLQDLKASYANRQLKIEKKLAINACLGIVVFQKIQK